MFHSIAEIEAASAALGNQLSAGIPIREAVARMAKLQPKYAELWTEAADAISRGNRLSLQLQNEWPESVIAALKAGEESGTLEEVFKRTSEAMRVRQAVRKIYGKLISPLAAFLGGVGVFLFFMIAVIPKLASTLGGGEQSFVLKSAVWMNQIVMGYWPVLALAAAGAVFGLIQWFKDPENIDKLISTANDIPQLGEALRDLYFGTWAYQVALLAAAGLPAKQQLLLSIKTLPGGYREGVARMAAEVEKRGHADSADPEKQEEGDPRREWPYFIAVAFITAHETGRIDKEMLRAAPILIDEGVRKLNKVISVADLVSKALAAAMIGLPLMAYFTQLSNSLSHSFS